MVEDDFVMRLIYMLVWLVIGPLGKSQPARNRRRLLAGYQATSPQKTAWTLKRQVQRTLHARRN
ncbi:hypothetical protein [Cupriavidus sp. IDO]|uniref:hypothetical protein n=1 Tax=Cupriavidus sp. IDO TaxID=1539142 RepID=UPI000578E871|nr:hypothetical protein [Cupriavidus sp. IDO]KWR83767.1 hypothetical protein RM96_28205 [Cupriavidus sp. IDO]